MIDTKIIIDKMKEKFLQLDSLQRVLVDSEAIMYQGLCYSIASIYTTEKSNRVVEEIEAMKKRLDVLDAGRRKNENRT